MRKPSSLTASLPQNGTGILPAPLRAQTAEAVSPSRSIISIDLLVALPVILLVGLVILSILLSILTS